MKVDLIEQTLTRRPAPSNGRIHNLHKAAVTTPDDEEVGVAGREPDHHNRGEGSGLGDQKMIDRHHHLLSLKSKLARDLFHGVDGGSIHIRLAGLSQTPVAHWNAKALEEAFKRRRTAVHGRCLHDLRNN
jgi:hypothetical protein